MSNRIELEELKSYLWESAVLLRTHIDAGSYKQYIFPLLFFKRISDVYDEEYNIALKESGGILHMQSLKKIIDSSCLLGIWKMYRKKSSYR